MPKGPNGQKRPTDAIGLAVMIGKIATGEIDDNLLQAAKRNAGLIGSAKRAEKLSPERRSSIARDAADKRWNKSDLIHKAALQVFTKIATCV